VPVGALSANSAFAQCPDGQVVLGAGFRTPAAPPFPNVVVTKMRRKDARTVEVRGLGFGGANSTIRAIAYCGPGPAPTEHLAEVVIDANDPVTSVQASCPAGKKLLWAGFHTQFPSALGNQGALPFGLHAKSSKHWIVRGFNPGTSAFVRSLAYCRA
jgi:hypothetical protein